MAGPTRRRGRPKIRADLAPTLGGRAEPVVDWDDVHPLTVRVDRLCRWHRPGLLFIGGVAHAMGRSIGRGGRPERVPKQEIPSGSLPILGQQECALGSCGSWRQTVPLPCGVSRLGRRLTRRCPLR